MSLLMGVVVGSHDGHEMGVILFRDHHKIQS